MKADPHPPAPFYPALESLRSVCAMAVAFGHFSYNSHLHAFAPMARAGSFVDFFFVLSGFVIANAYLDRLSNGHSATGFVIQRLFRLYPLHLATLILVGAAQLFSWKVMGRADQFGEDWPLLVSLNLLLSHAWAFGLGPILNVPSWSISVELYAYLLFCALCLVARSRFAKTTLILVCCIAALTFMTYAFLGGWLNTTEPWPMARGTFLFSRCIFGFTLGCLVLIVHRRMPIQLKGRWGTLAGLAMVALILSLMSVRDDGFVVRFVLPPIYAIFILTIIGSSQSGVVRFLETPRFRSFGQISYSIYLVHGLVAMGFGIALGLFAGEQRDHLSPFIGDFVTLAYAAAVIFVSTLSYRWIEEPGRQLGRRVAARYWQT